MPPSAASCLSRALFLALITTLLPAAEGLGEGAAVPEYAAKAAFLLNIAKYATWPPSAFPDSAAPIVIGILGDDPFGSILDRVVSGRIINDRRITVRHSKRAAMFVWCPRAIVPKKNGVRWIALPVSGGRCAHQAFLDR